MMIRLKSRPATGVAAGFGSALRAATPAASTGTHHLMIYKPDSIRSIAITLAGPYGTPEVTRFRSFGSGADWFDGHEEVDNGTRVILRAYTSSNCTTGLSVARKFLVPYHDGLTYFWAYMA
jgi:hypothetical protein